MSAADIVQMKIAEFVTARYAYEMLAAQHASEKAEAERLTANVVLAAVKNRARPSLTLAAKVRRQTHEDGHTYYIAAACGLEVEGSTPEIAFDNFDHEWTQGQ